MTSRTPIPGTVTLHVPFRVVKRGGRKEMQLPEGVKQPRRTDSTLVKALARAFRWKRMLESSEFATIAELAEREGIAASYMTRVLRLSLLAPDIVEAILQNDAPRLFVVEDRSNRPEICHGFSAHFLPQALCLCRVSNAVDMRRITLPSVL